MSTTFRLTLLCMLLVVFRPAYADDGPAPSECPDTDACAVEQRPPPPAMSSAALPESGPAVLQFFWGIGCPHCAEAEPFVTALEKETPGLRVERWEVRQDAEGRRRFLRTMQALGAEAVGIPAFVVGSAYRIGYSKGTTDGEVRDLVQAAMRGETTRAAGPIDLPIVGELDPRSMSLPVLTVVIGLLDGVNPCAMWVLLVLLGILTHVRSRSRLLLFGGAFVVMSGVVYFVFMTTWSLVFQLSGLSHSVTIALGVLVLAMGVVNLKELVWFKRGVSLTIPDRAKPKLFRRMRAVAAATSLPAALFGVLVLAFLVNLVELGCTLGLPAAYTRILSLRGLSGGLRYAYLGLYNVAYVVPLGLIVVAYALTAQRLVLGERGAKILKGISGTLLVLFGLVFLLWPESLY